MKKEGLEGKSHAYFASRALSYFKKSNLTM